MLRNIFWHYSTQFGFILHYSWQFFTHIKIKIDIEFRGVRSGICNLWRNQTCRIQLKCKENNSNGQFFSRSGPIWKEWKKKNLYTLLQNFWSCAIISQDGLLPTASQCKSPLAPHGAAVGSGTTVAHRADRRQKHLASIKREVQLRYAHTIPGIY